MEESKAPRDPSKPDSDPDSDETQEVPTVVMQPTEEEPASVTKQAEKTTDNEQASTPEPVEQAGPEKKNDHRAHHEKESDDKTLYESLPIGESQVRMVLRYPSPSLQRPRFNEQDICFPEYLPGKEEHRLHEYSLPGDREPRFHTRHLSGKQRHREEAGASRRLGQEQLERNLAHKYEQETGSEHEPDNNIPVGSVVSDDLNKGFLEALTILSDPLGIPEHEPGTEARSLFEGSSPDESTRYNRPGDNMSCVRTTPSESADDRYPVTNTPSEFFGEAEDPEAETEARVSSRGSISMNDDGNPHDFEADTENPRQKDEKTTEVVVAETLFRIPDNTIALGRNLETNSLLTMSSTLLLGVYPEDRVSSGEAVSRQHHYTGDFPMLRFAATRTGQVVVATDTRIRVSDEREEVHVENLNDQIQDLAAADNFVYALLSTSLLIYTMEDSGRLEHYRTVDLRASSGRLAVYGNYVYIIREQQRMIKRLNMTTFEVTTFLSDLSHPRAIAVDTSGSHIFYADDHDVRIVDMRGNHLGEIHVGTPIDDLVELNGILYVLTPQGLRRYKYNTDTSAWDDLQ